MVGRHVVDGVDVVLRQQLLEIGERTDSAVGTSGLLQCVLFLKRAFGALLVALHHIRYGDDNGIVETGILERFKDGPLTAPDDTDRHPVAGRRGAPAQGRSRHNDWWREEPSQSQTSRATFFAHGARQQVERAVRTPAVAPSSPTGKVRFSPWYFTITRDSLGA